MSDLMCRIEKYAKVEDEIKSLKHKETKVPGFKKEKDQGRRPGFLGEGKLVFEAVNTIFEEPIFKILPQIKDKPYFRWPRKLPVFPRKEDHKDYCSYYQDRGHRMGPCHSLQFHLEDLVKEGHLKEFIDKSRNENNENPPRAQQGDQERNRERTDKRGYANEVQPPSRNRERKNVQRPAIIHVIHIEQYPRAARNPVGNIKEICEVSASPSKCHRVEPIRGSLLT